MAKIGVYIPTTNNPLFLRFTVLQILEQTRVPDVIAIFYNNMPSDYAWAIKDLIPLLRNKGCKVIHRLVQEITCLAEIAMHPIRDLLNSKCDQIFCFEHDDIYFSNHIEHLVEFLDQGYDFVSNKQAGWLEIDNKKPYKLDYRHFDHSQTHTMASSSAFSRKFAEKLVLDIRHWMQLIQSRGDKAHWEFIREFDGLKNFSARMLAPDTVMTLFTLPYFKSYLLVDGSEATSIYVLHGSNSSTSHLVENSVF